MFFLKGFKYTKFFSNNTSEETVRKSEIYCKIKEGEVFKRMSTLGVLMYASLTIKTAFGI